MINSMYIFRNLRNFLIFFFFFEYFGNFNFQKNIQWLAEYNIDARIIAITNGSIENIIIGRPTVRQ